MEITKSNYEEILRDYNWGKNNNRFILKKLNKHFSLLDFLHGWSIFRLENRLYNKFIVIKVPCTLDENKKGKILLRNIIFEKQLQVNNDIEQIIFENCIFKGGILPALVQEESTNVIVLSNCKVDSVGMKTPKNRSVQKDKNIFTIINIQKGTSVDECNIGYPINCIHSENGTISNLNIFGNIEKIKLINVKGLSNCTFDGARCDSDKGISVDGTCIKNLIIKKSYFKNDYCKFSNLEVTEKLVVDDVDFGKTVFNNAKFPKEKNKFINHPIFNECIFNEVDFGDYTIYSTEDSEEEKKETYRQLKHVMEKNSNFTESNKFYTLEMEQYRKNNKTSWWDKIILFIQKWSSNYGQNWLFPAFWIIVTSLSFSMYNYLSPEDYCPYSFMKIWEKYLAGPLTLKDDINVINFIYLLIYAFLSYQLIISLRRNTKK